MKPQEKVKRYKYIFRHKMKDVKIIFNSTDVPQAILELASIVTFVSDWNMRRLRQK